MHSSAPNLRPSSYLLETVQLRESVDIYWARHRVSLAAVEAGLTDREVWSVAITVCELGSNVLKFAGTGQVQIALLDYPNPGIRIIVEDEGPGIENIENALEDGYSEGRFIKERDGAVRLRGLGAGLGAVRRLMDRVTIENREEGGLRVVAEKYAFQGLGQ